MKKSLFILFALIVSLASVVVAQDDVDFKVPERGGEGTVVVSTDPPGSLVYLDGEEIGKTPLNVKFRSGRWDLLIIDQGVELVKERFNVFPNKVNEFKKSTAMPYGNIKVSTKPGKCDIYVNGELADGTDGSYLLIKGLDAGDHMVKAVCGRKSKEVMVTVPNEKTVDLMIDVYKKD